MTHSIITTDQLAKLREALDVAKDCINPEVSFADEVVSDCREALSILDSLPEVEVVAWVFRPHGELLWPNEVEAKNPIEINSYAPLYGSKT